MILLFVFSLKAQVSMDKTTERYIKITRIDKFFVNPETEPNMIVCSFELANIFENESSKPIFVDVNEIPNVVLFSIKSRSERFENQRNCYLKMNHTNYLSTFRLVVDRMKVKYILCDDKFISVSDFLSKSL